MPNKTVHTKILELPRETLFDGALERCAVRSDGSLVTFNWIKPDGQHPPPHAHPFDQLSFIVEGRMEFEVDGELFDVGPGESLAIPADAQHTARIVGDEPVLNVDIFAPVRDDYMYLVAHEKDAFA